MARIKINGKLKPRAVHFFFRDRNQEIEVRFCHDEHGQPNIVTFFLDGEMIHVERNDSGSFKPCMTHARELLSRLTAKPANNMHARQRASRQRAQPAKLQVWNPGA